MDKAIADALGLRQKSKQLCGLWQSLIPSLKMRLPAFLSAYGRIFSKAVHLYNTHMTGIAPSCYFGSNLKH